MFLFSTGFNAKVFRVKGVRLLAEKPVFRAAGKPFEISLIIGALDKYDYIHDQHRLIFHLENKRVDQRENSFRNDCGDTAVRVGWKNESEFSSKLSWQKHNFEC